MIYDNNIDLNTVDLPTVLLPIAMILVLFSIAFEFLLLLLPIVLWFVYLRENTTGRPIKFN